MRLTDGYQKALLESHMESVTKEQREMAARLIEYLKNVQMRPAMYFGGLFIEPAVHFLHGFGGAACIALGVEWAERILSHQKVSESRGWPFRAKHPYHQMVEKGMSAPAIIDELINIELEWLRLMAASEFKN
jgi:hypothetical protein